MTSKLTKERLQEIAEDGFLKHGESKELARMALAAMDSEPVAWTWHYREQWHVTNDKRRAEFVAKDGDVAVLPLYRHAHPAPEYPEVLPCQVLLEPGLRFGKGIKTSTMLAAMARRAVYESDMAALSPEERAEFQAGIEGFKALIAQPAPVAPEKMPSNLRGLIEAHTDRLFDDDDAQEIWNACRAAMLAAAPQSPGSEPATVPGKWIPVSERMPESNKFVLVSNGVWVGQGLYDDSEHLESDEHWQDEHREFINVLHHPVTHWMPLPAAPQEVLDGK
ncbi:TPA: DUF551 domain-containing protein [Klebsiella pneumoniae]